MAPLAANSPAIDRAGVLTKATVRAADLLGLNSAVLARVIGLSPATVSRMSNGEYNLAVPSKSAELAALVVRLYRSLDSLVGNDDALRKTWMRSNHRVFGKAPADAIQTVDGLTHVVRYLDASRAVI